MKYPICVVLASAVLMGFGVMMQDVPSLGVEGGYATLLSDAEMASTVGGYKHCANGSCPGAPCMAYWELIVSTGLVGRECTGSTASSCSATVNAKCATIYMDCNENCTTCTSSNDEMITTRCCSQ